ncbi:ankycorbin-like isoform X2 [Asterias rubens]|uniref:ankycorbin-like isoform X2 n=1 Tax=Asterias rubens TaxID=7604 RepID=UPI001454F4E0|nr:ankycorbin-like isoform X2 [Asterias rubens]
MAEIILAAKHGLYNRVLAELREGTPVDIQDIEGGTPLYWSACGGHSDICRLLLSKGANPNLAVQWGSSPLHAAADRGKTECIKYLIRYGANISAQNNNGDTPLHLASFRGHSDACIILLTHGADQTILNNNGKTSQQEAQGAQHKDITKILTEKKTANREVLMPKQYLRASDSDDALLRTDKKTSLRHNLLASSLEKREVELRERPGTRQIPMALNQLSDTTSRETFHHHHRPFSDPTPAFLGGRPNIADFSDPTKEINIMSDEIDFHRKQDETERDQFLGAIDGLQLKVALLTSQKEALEAKLQGGSSSPTQDMVVTERRNSDTRGRQLSNELFLLKESPLVNRKRSSIGSSTDVSSLLTSVGTSSHKDQSPEGSLTKSICSFMEKPYLCQSTMIHQVFSHLQNDKTVFQTLKASTNQRLYELRLSLNERNDVFSLDEKGKEWLLNEDYQIIEGRPVDRELKQSEDGLISQICVRILHKKQTYVIKVLMNHRRSPKPSGHKCPGDSLGTEFNILQSLSDNPHLNITRMYHNFEIQTSELNNFSDVSKFLDGTLYSQLADKTAMVVFPDYCTTLSHLVSNYRADRTLTYGSIRSPSELFVLRLLLQLLEALSYLQINGIAHRDINSRAIVVDWNLRLVLGEFGYARRLRNDEGQGIPFVEKSQIGAGNPLAWSPELLQYSVNGPPKSWQKDLTLLDVYESSDLYSTAAMLCCLFNRLPDGEQSPPSPGMIAKCLPTISLEVPGFLSKEGKALFGRMLKDNPANRPTLREAILRTGMMLYGPEPSSINSLTEMDTWLQSQHLRLLATPPQSKSRELDELTRCLDWELCHGYMSNVSAVELWHLYNDPI